MVLASAGGCKSSWHEWWHNGFKVGPDYCPPPAPVAADWIEPASETRVLRERSNDCSWWTVFDDPVLNGLVETAYRQNLDLQAAGTRILEARAQRGIAVGNLFPQSQTAVSAYAHAQLPQSLNLPLPGTAGLWVDGFNASWEIDLWGRYRRAIEAADAQLAGSMEDYGDVLVILLADVANNYVQLRTFEQRLQFARANVAIQRGTLGVADERFKNGAATELDVRQARSNLAQTEALIPPLVAGHRQASNRLCTLLGLPPEDLAGRLAPRPIPAAPVQVAVGMPADLLRRRPDVRRAERAVAAQSAQIGVAKADLFPRFALSGFVGVAASDISKLFTPGSLTTVALPSFQWSILNYGRIANNIRVQDARLEGAALRYQQAVLIAGREVEDALVGFLQAQEQARHLQQSVEEAQRSVELVVLQYETGSSDFNRVYNTQSLLVSQQDQLATTQGNTALNLIAVYRAMGGGWRYFLDNSGEPRSRAVELLPPTGPGAQPDGKPAGEPIPTPVPQR